MKGRVNINKRFSEDLNHVIHFTILYDSGFRMKQKEREREEERETSVRKINQMKKMGKRRKGNKTGDLVHKT